MQDDSSPAPLDGQRSGRKRLTFDPTINAGHLLTFGAMLMALFAGWTALDKRVVVLEEARLYQQRRDDAQDLASNGRLAEIRDSMKEIQRGVDDLRRDQQLQPRRSNDGR